MKLNEDGQEAEKASYQAMQMATEHQAATVPIVEMAAQQEQGAAEVPMDVGVPQADERGTKRMAEDTPSVEGHKKARIGLFTFTHFHLIL